MTRKIVQKQSIPEIRAAAFAVAREKCALSAEELAHLACLSKKQIQQIENGGRDTFYSPTIKFNAAKKVAKLIQLDEKDAFDFGPQVELSSARVDELAQSESQPAKPGPAEDVKKESADSELTKPSLAIDSKESPPANPNASQKSDGVSAVSKQSVHQAKKTHH
jgi:cytoskeleton protein RodZ